jgi:hypothetical protein
MKIKEIQLLANNKIFLNFIEGKEDYYSVLWNAHSIYFYDLQAILLNL